MKTKHLLTGLVLPALFAACTAEEVETSKGVIAQEDLSARPAVGSVALNWGNSESRAELGENAFNSIKFNADEDAIGARIIDTYAAANVKDADGNRVAWKDYTITDYASSNYQYVFNGEGWKTTALMVEGNYMFYYPYNAKNVARGPLEIITPTHQTVKPGEVDGERNPIAELYAGENPAFVGYKFIGAEGQGLVQSVDMKHVFAYPQITLVNDYTVYNKKTKEDEGEDITITKIILSGDFFEKYVVNHNAFQTNLTPEMKYWKSETKQEGIEAGNWTDSETLLKNARTTTIADKKGDEVDITVEFEGGLKLGYGEEYAFNVVLPAEEYAVGALTMTVYTEDDMMFGTVNEKTKVESVKEFANEKIMTFAPGKRYSTEEYNFPTKGEPTPKPKAGNSAVFEISGDLIDAVAPATVIRTLAEFEEFLDGISKNISKLEEVTDERNVKENQFVLAEAENEDGEGLGYAELKINAEFLALLEEYNYDGEIHFTSKMLVEGGDEGIVLNNMIFGEVAVVEGNVTVGEEITSKTVDVNNGAELIVAEDSKATLGNIVVDNGKVIINQERFIEYGTGNNTVTVTKELDKKGKPTGYTGKLIVNADQALRANSTTKWFVMNAGNLVIGENATVDFGGDGVMGITGGTITNNGSINLVAPTGYTIPAGVTLENHGTIEGKETLNNAGHIDAYGSIEVGTNTGKICVMSKTVNVTVKTSADTEGVINNTEAGKVYATNANQVVYAEIGSVTGNILSDGTKITKKYDTYAAIDKYVLTGAMDIESNITYNKAVEFASGSSLYVGTDATLTLKGGAIISSNVAWNGRNSKTSVVAVPEGGSIEYRMYDGNGDGAGDTYYNITAGEIKVTVAGEEVDLQKEAILYAAENGGTVKLTADCSKGITVPENNMEFAVNLNGHAINVTKEADLVGSTGTESQVLQVLKGNKITISNGRIISSVARTLIMNYADLTLSSVELETPALVKNKQNEDVAPYAISNNNSTLNLIGSTSIKAPVAFDIYDFASAGYATDATVTVNTTGKIEGNIEMGGDGTDRMVDLTLNVVKGTVDGNLLKDSAYRNLISVTVGGAATVEGTGWTAGTGWTE